MAFHLGRPIAVLIGLSVLTAGLALTRPAPKRADVVAWVFAESHARVYRSRVIDGEPSLAERFQSDTGKSVDIRLVSNNALNIRLNSLFDRDVSVNELPDVAEIEIGFVGRYFRPPIDMVGFLPLNDLLAKSPYRDQILPQRLATWSKGGQIFGIPHDVHPVSITYRKDLFDQAGVDLTRVRTWAEFHDACVRYRDYWKRQGVHDRNAIELSKNASDLVMMMLMQQRVSLIDEKGTSHLTDPRVAKTILFYAQMVAGPRAIGAPANPGPNQWANDVAEGRLGALVTADWRAGYLPKYAPTASGKLAMIALPRFDLEHDAPTASWGGTMIGIPRRCKQPELAWKLIEQLYFTPEAMAARKQQAMILPPIKTAWADPMWHGPMPYFGGQKVGELYISLAEQMPPVEVSPFRAVAQQLLTFVLSKAVDDIDSGRVDGLEGRVQDRLRQAEEELKKRVEFGSFE
ncbi:MAG: extracellular solute-binding protein [Tepidisphaeraceae bacterium]